MSGGALGYLFRKVEDAASEIRAAGGRESMRRFADHLTLVANALHDVEWELSNDYCEGDADKAIRAVIGQWPAHSAINDDDPYMTEEELSATEAEESAFDPEHPSNTGL